MNKPFRALAFHGEQSHYVKALYYAFGASDYGPKVDEIKFAETYANYMADGGHIAVQDCYRMFVAGQTEFRR